MEVKTHMKFSRCLKRTIAVMTMLAAFVFAQVPTMASTSDGKAPITKQAQKVTDVAIRAERTFNVEGKIIGQLAIDRLDANWQAIVLPEAPVGSIDHVPLNP
jgi:hypothetical protein